MAWKVHQRPNVTMPLHLIKLCVGCDSVDDLEDWIAKKLKEKKRRRLEAGAHPHHPHGAKARRGADRTAARSYWVIRGQIICRERILDIRPFADKDGIGRCRVVLDGKLRAGRAAAPLGLPGLALSRRQGRAARSRPRRAGRCRACRRRMRRELRELGPALDRDIVDQPGLADLGRHQQPDRPVLARGDRARASAAWRASR